MVHVFKCGNCTQQEIAVTLPAYDPYPIIYDQALPPLPDLPPLMAKTPVEMSAQSTSTNNTVSGGSRRLSNNETDGFDTFDDDETSNLTDPQQAELRAFFQAFNITNTTNQNSTDVEAKFRAFNSNSSTPLGEADV